MEPKNGFVNKGAPPVYRPQGTGGVVLPKAPGVVQRFVPGGAPALPAHLPPKPGREKKAPRLPSTPAPPLSAPGGLAEVRQAMETVVEFLDSTSDPSDRRLRSELATYLSKLR